MTLRNRLFELADSRYREFSLSLLPEGTPLIGVRLPLLRKMASEICRSDWRQYMATAQNLYFEERMLQGMVIARLPAPICEKLKFAARHIPKIDNWSLCDSFCWRLRKEEREAVWHFIQPYFHAAGTYEVRFAVVMALYNFVDAEHLDTLLDRFGTIHATDYYARMAVAWAVATCHTHFPERTTAWLRNNCPLDDWTFNKALQKIIESRQTPLSGQERIRSLKRRQNKSSRTIRFEK